ERPSQKLMKRIFGPTTERIISQMPCPVLIARQKARPLQRWLLCEGGRDPSLIKRASQQLLPMMQQAETITVLHVMSQISAAPGVPGWELRAEADELMSKHTPEGELLVDDIRSLELLNIPARAKIRHGLVVEEILTEARSGDYDVVVIGAHESKGWDRVLLDNLARQIVLQAEEPILVL
ncbi:MAG TPA: universal stress protein, partial [Anaerolineales bacterium]|nr:universal stress protein [Anaerolineales bacterium]